MHNREKMKTLEDTAAQLVEGALKAGADACDCVVARGNSIGISVRDGKVENTERTEADEFSLRVFCGKKTASVSANQTDDIAGLCERAVSMAKVSPEDPHAMLAPVDKLATDIPDLDLSDSFEPSAQQLTQSALACEAAGLDVKGVAKSMGASAGWGATGFVLATSTGFVGSFERTGNSISAAMIAGEGTAMERDYDFHSSVHYEDLEQPEAIGKSAGERVIKRLSPRQVASGAFPVIFDRRQAAGILRTLAGAINASAITRKTSFLRECLGKKICRDEIEIICDPLMKRGQGSRPVDGEGISGKSIAFVDKGTLTQWVLDCASAHELGLETNARAARSGAGTSPSTTNLFLKAGDKSLEDMISSVEKGLYLTETIGHGINMVNGDYSKGAGGFWIENGEVQFPVSEITVAGNLKEIFANMVPADDLEMRFSTNSPSLYIDGLTIGGQ